MIKLKTLINEVSGRGFFGLKKGKKLSSKDKLKKGDLILYHSKQFNADNLIKVVDIRTYGDLIQYDSVYWDGGKNKRIGNESFSVKSSDLNRGEYFLPKK